MRRCFGKAVWRSRCRRAAGLAGASEPSQGPIPYKLIPDSEFSARANEIVSAWDQWQAQKEVAKEREGVAEAQARWGEAVESYHAMGRRIARAPAKTMADVLAKLLAAAPDLDEDDLNEDGPIAIAVGAARDALVLTGQEALS